MAVVRSKYQLGGRAHGNRRHSRRRTDGLLRTAEANVNPLLVHIERYRGERRDGVYNKQCAQIVRDLAVSVDAGDNAGRGLPVREADDLDLFALASAAHIFGIHWLPVWRFNFYDFR